MFIYYEVVTYHMTNKTYAIFDKYLNFWSRYPLTEMYGVNIRGLDEVYDKKLSEIPKALRIRGSRCRSNSQLVAIPEIFLNIDVSNFPFLYRGVAPGNSRKSNVPPMNVLIERYDKNDYVSAVLSDSSAVYLTKNPLVAFSGDSTGLYSTHEGMILVIDPSGLKTEETELTYSINEVVSQVPTKNIKMIYLNENDAKNISKDCKLKEKIKTHNFSSSEQFRKEGALEIMTKTANNPEILFEKRYTSKEEETALFEGIDLYKRWIADSGKLLMSDLFYVCFNVDYVERKISDLLYESKRSSSDGPFEYNRELYRNRQLSIRPEGSKLNSLNNFKEAFVSRMQRLEDLLDDSSFASNKYMFIENFADATNREDAENFEFGKDGRLIRNLHDEFVGNRESETFNFTKLDAELSDYLFNRNYQFKTEFSGC